MLVAAAFSHDVFWYRAQVVKVLDNGMVDLYYVDYGDNDVISVQNVRTLSSHYYSLPFQAIECLLADVQVEDGQWSDDACSVFEELTYCAKWKVIMARIEAYVQMGDSDRVLPQLTLFDTHGVEDVNICKELVRLGYAAHTKKNDISKSKNIDELDKTNTEHTNCDTGCVPILNHKTGDNALEHAIGDSLLEYETGDDKSSLKHVIESLQETTVEPQQNGEHGVLQHRSESSTTADGIGCVRYHHHNNADESTLYDYAVLGKDCQRNLSEVSDTFSFLMRRDSCQSAIEEDVISFDGSTKPTVEAGGISFEESTKQSNIDSVMADTEMFYVQENVVSGDVIEFNGNKDIADREGKDIVEEILISEETDEQLCTDHIRLGEIDQKEGNKRGKLLDNNKDKQDSDIKVVEKILISTETAVALDIWKKELYAQPVEIKEYSMKRNLGICTAEVHTIELSDTSSDELIVTIEISDSETEQPGKKMYDQNIDIPEIDLTSPISCQRKPTDKLISIDQNNTTIDLTEDFDDYTEHVPNMDEHSNIDTSGEYINWILHSVPANCGIEGEMTSNDDKDSDHSHEDDSTDGSYLLPDSIVISGSHFSSDVSYSSSLGSISIGSYHGKCDCDSTTSSATSSPLSQQMNSSDSMIHYERMVQGHENMTHEVDTMTHGYVVLPQGFVAVCNCETGHYPVDSNAGCKETFRCYHATQPNHATRGEEDHSDGTGESSFESVTCTDGSSCGEYVCDGYQSPKLCSSCRHDDTSVNTIPDTINSSNEFIEYIEDIISPNSNSCKPLTYSPGSILEDASTCEKCPHSSVTDSSISTRTASEFETYGSTVANKSEGVSEMTNYSAVDKDNLIQSHLHESSTQQCQDVLMVDVTEDGAAKPGHCHLSADVTAAIAHIVETVDVQTPVLVLSDHSIVNLNIEQAKACLSDANLETKAMHSGSSRSKEDANINTIEDMRMASTPYPSLSKIPAIVIEDGASLYVKPNICQPAVDCELTEDSIGITRFLDSSAQPEMSSISVLKCTPSNLSYNISKYAGDDDSVDVHDNVPSSVKGIGEKMLDYAHMTPELYSPFELQDKQLFERSSTQDILCDDNLQHDAGKVVVVSSQQGKSRTDGDDVACTDENHNDLKVTPTIFQNVIESADVQSFCYTSCNTLDVNIDEEYMRNAIACEEFSDSSESIVNISLSDFENLSEIAACSQLSGRFINSEKFFQEYGTLDYCGGESKWDVSVPEDFSLDKQVKSLKILCQEYLQDKTTSIN